MRKKYLRPTYLILGLIGFSLLNGPTMAQISDANSLYKSALVASCANCHGTNGNGLIDASIPLINKLTSAQKLTQLQAYKNGTRNGTIMPQLAKGYTDEQLITVADQLGKNQ